MQHAARGVDDLGNLRDRLDHAGLVIGEHHRNKRMLGPSKRASKSMKIDHTVAGDRQFFDRFGRETPAAAHRRMLDRREKQPVAQGLNAADLDRRGQRQHIGFGGATGEGDVLGLAAGQIRDFFPCHFNELASRPSFGMDRGRIAGQPQRGDDGGVRLLPQRGGGIPVEVGPFAHGFSQYSYTVTALAPAKSLLFALGIVLEAAITRQLITTVAGVNSGIHIFRIILN